MKVLFGVLALCLVCLSAAAPPVGTDVNMKDPSIDISFAVIGDWGSNNKIQRSVAKAMEKVARDNRVDFVVSTGDNFYANFSRTDEPRGGVSDINDPQFEETFQRNFVGYLRQVPFLNVLGNHDYMGNVSAQLQYSRKDWRWVLPSRYYSRKITYPKGSIRFLFMDTNPYISKYINRPRNKRMAVELKSQRGQADRQYDWLKKKMESNKADWLFVAGHHPAVAVDTLMEHDATYYMKWLPSMFTAGGVCAYFSGHVHSQQLGYRKGTMYVLSGAGSRPDLMNPNWKNQGRPVFFADNTPGFVIVRLSGRTMVITFYGFDGNALYSALVRRRSNGACVIKDLAPVDADPKSFIDFESLMK